MRTETQKAPSRKRLIFTASAAACLLLLFSLFLVWQGQNEKTALTTFAMGSYVEQTVYGRNREEAAARAASAVTELENLISWRVEGSDISRLNENGPEGAAIDLRTWNILNVCLSVSRNSGGAFDPTIAPVSRLWNFDDGPRVPDEAELKAALEQVDYHALSLPFEGDAVLAADRSLDLGAVGKGAACDAVLESWKQTGASHGVAAVGGSVGLYGSKAWGEPWTIAVRDPRSAGSLGTLSLKRGCVSTSGSYEKTFTEAGKTYHHLLDPHTGRPAESGLVSVTVWRGEEDGMDGAFTDALATACFVLGLEKSLPLLERYQAEAVFIDEQNRAFVTDGLQDAFTLASTDYTLENLP